LFKKLKKWKDSEIFFQKAIKTYLKFGDKINEGEAYYELGDMLILKRDKDLAKKNLIKSQKILKNIGAKKYLGEIEEKLNNLKKIF